MDQVVFYLGLIAAAFFCAFFGVVALRHWAERQMLDVPNSRSSHTRPTPRGGGLVIVLFTLMGLWLYGLLGDARVEVQVLIWYSLGACVIALVSWLDDLRTVQNRIRFTAHVAGAVFVLWAVGYWHQVDLPFGSSMHIGWLGMPLALFWIVGFTNAYNFMDGIDGLAGGQAVVAGVAWVGLGLLIDQPVISVLGVLIAGCSLGFLGHNWPPARIFMGDVGSAFLGYTFAVLPVLAGLSDPRLALAGLLVVWPFVFDTAFTLVRRLRKGENIFMAHRSHLYQRLVIAGYGHGVVTVAYLVLSVIGVALAFAWVMAVPGSDGLVVGGLPALALGLWRWVVWKEKSDDGRQTMDDGKGERQCGVQSAECGKTKATMDDEKKRQRQRRFFFRLWAIVIYRHLFNLVT